MKNIYNESAKSIDSCIAAFETNGANDWHGEYSATPSTLH